jgi:hypothetical protein
MIEQESLLGTLVRLVDRTPVPPPPAKRPRGRPKTDPDRLFLKALGIRMVRHLHTVHELLTVREQDMPEMRTLRTLVTIKGQFPVRRTWERRLQALPDTLPAQIGCLGCRLVALIQPWASCRRAAAIDSTVLRARGGSWHTKDRDAGVVPHPAIDSEAHWTTSGWHGWMDGWKLPIVTTVAAVWIPLAAELTAANAADSEVAPGWLCRLPAAVRYVLGDQSYTTPELHDRCMEADRTWVTTKRGRYPHPEDGVEVRRICHQLRSAAIENLNEQFQGSFDGHGHVPTKGLVNTRRFALGAIVVYQLALWDRYEHDQELRVGLKAFLKAA